MRESLGDAIGETKPWQVAIVECDRDSHDDQRIKRARPISDGDASVRVLSPADEIIT